MILLSLAGMMMSADEAAPAPPAAMAAHRWRERVLLVFARDAAGLQPQDRALAGAAAGLRDRDLRVVRVTDAGVTGLDASAAALRTAYGVAPGAFAVRLVGKDGHVALRRDRPISDADLFAAIDAMPMRRDEMKRRR